MSTEIVGSNEPSLASDQIKVSNQHGQNGPQRSSLLPGETTTCAIDVQKPDAALDALKAGKGPAAVGGWQTRKLGGGNVPAHDGMRDANAGGSPSGKVEAGLAASSGEPIRKP